jgi:hypothetical protein
MLYSSLCANDDEEEEFYFSFFYDPADKGNIHFKTRPHVTWGKQETEISDTNPVLKLYYLSEHHRSIEDEVKG